MQNLLCIQFPRISYILISHMSSAEQKSILNLFSLFELIFCVDPIFSKRYISNKTNTNWASLWFTILFWLHKTFCTAANSSLAIQIYEYPAIGVYEKISIYETDDGKQRMRSSLCWCHSFFSILPTLILFICSMGRPCMSLFSYWMNVRIWVRFKRKILQNVNH